MQEHEGHRLRLRERFDSSGLDSFAQHEALELLLTYAIPRKDTKPIAKALIGRGSGESLQMAFSGQGWLLVQPSEGRIVPTSGGGGGGLMGNILGG